MDRLIHKKLSADQRAKKVRTVIKSTASRPRLSVHISNKHVLAQIIDDTSGKTLVYVSSTADKNAGASLSQKAAWVGTKLAVAAKKAKVSQVVFDRGAKQYHGRIKSLAEAARAGGMEF